MRTGQPEGNDVKEFVLAQRLMLKLIPKFRKSVLDTIYGWESHMKCFLFFFGTFSVISHSSVTHAGFFFLKYEENVTTNELKGCVLFSKGAWEQRWRLIHRDCTNFWSGLVWTHTPNRQTTSISCYLRGWMLALMAVTPVVPASVE